VKATPERLYLAEGDGVLLLDPETGAAKIVVGNGAHPRTTMGPVCGEVQLRNVLAWIEPAVCFPWLRWS
jgi:acyl-CoA reductase-like NAD-dependent aldehyde dehydrogenase